MNDCKKFLSCPEIVGNPYQWQNPCPCKDYEPSYQEQDCSKGIDSTTDKTTDNIDK